MGSIVLHSPAGDDACCLHLLCPTLKDVHVQDVEDQGDVVRIAACASTVEASCPECGVSSARMHSRYRRTLRDLAACGRPLVIELDVRRFRCGEAACGRKIFADRFHLWQNLAQALEKTVRAHRSCLQEAPDPNTAMQEETGGEAEPAERPRTVDSYRNERPLVARTQERYAQVQALKNNGASLNAISRELGLAFRTARKVRDRHQRGRTSGPDPGRSSKLDGFKPYLTRRWNQGCTNAAQLHTEIKADGFTGSRRAVQGWLQPLRGHQKVRQEPCPPPKPRRVTGWTQATSPVWSRSWLAVPNSPTPPATSAASPR